MFTSIFRSSALCARSTTIATSASRNSIVRPLSTASILYKKIKKGGKDHKNEKGAKDDDSNLKVEDPSHVLSNLEAKYIETLEESKKRITETKLGSANPNIFNKLEVEINKRPHIFTSLAQTALKGRNLIITVFDPNNTKNVVSSILASGMNMNPEAVPNFAQQLKVPLPPPTAESRQQVAKELKKEHDIMKNSHDRFSLSTARSAAMKELKSFKATDDVRKVTQEVEKLHKKYGAELESQFKAAEKSVLK